MHHSAEEVVRALKGFIGKLGPETTRIGGSVAFDAGVAGTWLVDLETPGGTWKDNPSGDELSAATVCIQGDSEAIAALLLDVDAVADLLSAGRLRVIGDGVRLVALGEALASGARKITFH